MKQSCSKCQPCSKCQRLISPNNIAKHERSCSDTPYSPRYLFTEATLGVFDCLFCGRRCKNKRGFLGHCRTCKANPDRQLTFFGNPLLKDKLKESKIGKSNQYSKAKTEGLPAPKLSDEARQRIRKSSLGRKHSEEFKSRLSELAKKRSLGGSKPSSRIVFQKANGELIKLDSSYEERFARILEELTLDWSRPEPFIWVDNNGGSHRYYPDFKVKDVYFDTKNDYLAIKDLPKIQAVRDQHPIRLEIVTNKNINKAYILEALINK